MVLQKCKSAKFLTTEILNPFWNPEHENKLFTKFQTKWVCSDLIWLESIAKSKMLLAKKIFKTIYILTILLFLINEYFHVLCSNDWFKVGICFFGQCKK